MIVLVCTCFGIGHFAFEKTTLHEIFLQNEFDINKVENFEIHQDNYDWYKTELSTKNITNHQNMIKYFDEVSSIQLRKHKPLFKESELYFDYYNYTSSIYLKLSYEEKTLIMSIYNTDFGLCDIRIYNNGETNKYNVYFNDFKDFLIDDYTN
ncbi:hypothetical protein JCM19376_40710 [Fusibacter bizertensis]